MGKKEAEIDRIKNLVMDEIKKEIEVDQRKAKQENHNFFKISISKQKCLD